MNKGFNYNKTLLNTSTSNPITTNMTSIFVENAVDEIIDGYYTFNNAINMNNNNLENVNLASYNSIKTNIIGEKTSGSNVDFINSVDMNNNNITDANIYGDIYSSNGTKILENGTNGSDSFFRGNLEMDYGGTIKLYDSARTEWAQFRFDETEDKVEIQRGFVPDINNLYDFGNSTLRFKNFYSHLIGNVVSSTNDTIVDYTNKRFTGNNIQINSGGNIQLLNSTGGWAQIHFNESEDKIQLQRGLIPSVNKYWDIGTPSVQIGNIYSDTFTGNSLNLNSGGTIKLYDVAGTNWAEIFFNETADKFQIQRGIIPQTNNFIDIGTASTKFHNIYSEMFTGDIYSSNGTKILDNGTDGTDGNYSGNLNGTTTALINRSMMFTAGGFGVDVGNNLASHPTYIDGYKTDGFFYRLDGQFHLMVDDLFYICDDSTSGSTRGGQFLFDTRYGTFKSSGSISSNTGFLSFTGIHNIKETYEEYGLIVESTGNVDKTDKLNTIVETKLSNTNKSKSVYGVSYNTDETIGVVSLGEATMLVTNFGGNIMNGDYICSSEIPGYGMLQDDDLLHNYTVAKSTENINWDNITDTIEHNGQSYKRVLIAVTLHCG